jgi:drug/metabolite transporter (DMT)-like permease
VQFAASLAITLPLAWWLEPMRIEWNAPVLVAMGWSILVLTAGGISLMFYMLRHGRVTAVSSTMYLVPSVTAVMAWLLFGETLGTQAIAGMGVTLLGVYLVVARKPETPPS